MGVGRPEDLLDGVNNGIDMFDCVMPSRNARNATGFSSFGKLRMRNSEHRRSEKPLEDGCNCYCCTHHTRAYVHHLFMAEEMLGATLLTIHNLNYYCRLMQGARDAIDLGQFEAYRADCLARFEE
jgi:queuine tRNA-ribosyltransferase